MKMILVAAALLAAGPVLAQQQSSTGTNSPITNGGQTKPGTNVDNSALRMQNTPSSTSSDMNTSTMPADTAMSAPSDSGMRTYPPCKTRKDDNCRQRGGR